MSEFIHFWIHCVRIGWEWGDGIFEKIECFTILVSAFFLCHNKLQKHRDKWEENAMKAAFYIFAATFLFSTIFVASFFQYKQIASNLSGQTAISNKQQKELDDKSPKLHGFVNRSMLADEPGTSNSLVFLEVQIGNSGGSPSGADQFDLRVSTRNLSTNACEIYFTNEYTLRFWDKGKPYLLDLSRDELISEKAHKAIQPGDSPRGWLAFRLNGIQMNQYAATNLILSFADINDKKIYVTNGLSRSKPSAGSAVDALTLVLPGSDNIFHPVKVEVRTNNDWLPPELPPGCSNVIVFFGASQFIEPRQMAEISDSGTKFAIKDLPDYFLQNLDKVATYSPRQQYMWLKSAETSYTIGGRTFPNPIHPVIVSNRLYIEVEIPFSNERHKLVMSDAFDAELSPLPLNWDRNYSTNYEVNRGVYLYEIVNELTNPVLQVAYSAPNEVHINGIFQVDSNSILAAFGQQPVLATFNYENYGPTSGVVTASLQIENFHETLTLHSNETLASFGQRFTNEFFRPIFQYQMPIFKYPSNRHLGALEDRPNENDRGVTNNTHKPQ
jgi:hypothetical protein